MSDRDPLHLRAAPDTGLYNAKLGIWLFLASEVMLFGALFSSYILLRNRRASVAARLRAPQHPAGHAQHPGADRLERDHGDVVGLAQAERPREVPPLHGAHRSCCGFGFLGIKSYEYGQVPPPLYPPDNTFLAIYFMLTGLHGLHVIGGMIVNSYFWGPGAKLCETDPDRFANRIEDAGLYWHFVDLVWIFLFPVLYLL